MNDVLHLSYDPTPVPKQQHEVMLGMVAIGQIWRDFLMSQDEGSRVARGIFGGIVGIALAAPSGGQSLTWFGGAELLFATNQLLSGAADALDGSDENRNLMREGSRAVGGETGVKVYDVTEIGTIFFGSGNSFNRILKTTRKQEKIKEGSSLVKSTFDVYQLNIKPLVDE